MCGLVLSLLSFWQAGEAQTVALCNPTQTRNGSRLCVNLAFQNGKLVVDRNSSKLNASEIFTRSLSGGVDQAKTTFFNQLDQKLADRQKPYQIALQGDERTRDAAGQLNDPLTTELKTFTGSFQTYLEKFTTWSSAAPNRKSIGDVFGDSATTGEGLYAPLTTVSDDLALVFNDNSVDEGFDLASATFSFTVIDPVTNWNEVNIALPGADNDSRLKRIRKLLAPLTGQIWNPGAIKAIINRYYRQLDLTPVITIDAVTNDPSASGLSITIVEASRIARIVLPAQGDTDAKTYKADNEKILYVLLADKDFRSFIKNPVPVSTVPGSSVSSSRLVVDYQINFNHKGPYLDASRMQVQQLLLAQIGFIASIQGAEGSSLVGLNVVLDVQKIADTPVTPEGAAKPAPSTTNPGNVVTGHQQEADPTTDFEPRNKPETEKPAKPLKEKKNYIGGGFEYRPGQGVRFFGLGQRSRLGFPFPNGNISATAGASGSGIGTLNYFADYVLFNRLHRRVSLQLSGGSDSDPNRALAGKEMDQRTTTGSARLEFEPFRDRGGSLLRFYLEGRQSLVTLSQTNSSSTRQHLTTLDVGGLFMFSSVEVEHPRRLRLEPMVRFGFDVARDSPRFTKIQVTGNFHQQLPARLALDFSGLVSTASRNTPLFELPSFGGSEVVRGFRRDDALGRRLWSLQNELWMPITNTDTEAEEGLRTFLRDKVRLAAFVDVGGLYLPSSSKAGVRSGYGLGLRLIYNVLVLKVDYAYGVGVAATGGGHGKAYFSVGSNLPF
jgi:Omp85 superfamily domain